MVATLHRGWHHELTDLVQSAERRLVIAAPFISSVGANLVACGIQPSLRDEGRIEILTDLCPAHVADGSLVPEAVIALCRAATLSTLWHVPRLHAKVYIADESRAIVTSANLTAGGFHRNVEFGVRVDDPHLVSVIQSHFDDFRAAGTTIAIDDLLNYSAIAAEVRETTQRQRSAVDPRLNEALQRALNEAEAQLIQLRLAGGAIHTVFAKTIRYLLTKYGPLPTTRLHELVQSLHADLCDDTVDRVINGEHYGKKWKHAVRTAQQQLKRSGIAEYVEPIWRLVVVAGESR